MLLPPAPDNVLNLINCSSKKRCKTNAYTCKLNDFQCTELCQCTEECENGKSMEEEIEEQDVEDYPCLMDNEFVDGRRYGYRQSWEWLFFRWIDLLFAELLISSLSACSSSVVCTKVLNTAVILL